MLKCCVVAMETYYISCMLEIVVIIEALYKGYIILEAACIVEYTLYIYFILFYLDSPGRLFIYVCIDFYREC